MGRIIRQVFGTTRPRDIYLDLLTFDRMVTRPIVHIVYWVGLGMFTIAAFAVLGVSVGSALKDPSMMNVLLSVPFLIFSWLAILVGVLLWRSFCEFYLAVMSIADDLRHLRQHQEKLEAPAAAVAQAPAAPPDVAAVAESAIVPTTEAPVQPLHDPLEDPFFAPRFGRRDDQAV